MIISWHVTYWDHLGWRDKFARDEFTQRQKKYAAARRISGLATPQLLCDNSPFGSAAELQKIIARAAITKPEFVLNVAVKLEAKKISATIELKRVAGSTALSDVKIIPLLICNRATTQPLLGENKGVALVEHFIVLQAATEIPAASTLVASTTVDFAMPETIDAKDLSVAVLLENTVEMKTLECVITGVR